MKRKNRSNKTEAPLDVPHLSRMCTYSDQISPDESDNSIDDQIHQTMEEILFNIDRNVIINALIQKTILPVNSYYASFENSMIDINAR